MYPSSHKQGHPKNHIESVEPNYDKPMKTALMIAYFFAHDEVRQLSAPIRLAANCGLRQSCPIIWDELGPLIADQFTVRNRGEIKTPEVTVITLM
jgi:hypothetical protein